MAIHPVCDSCKQELSQYGAILLSPPTDDSEVKKIHLCVDCYELACATLSLSYS